MYFILKPDVALRSWINLRFAYQVYRQPEANRLSEADFKLLLQCDGKTELEDSKPLRMLKQLELIEPCEKGEKALSDWQQYRSYDNLYMPCMNLQITGRCNYSCLHCFNAKDSGRPHSELSLTQITALLDQAQSCGVHAFTVTGGEPLIHPDFLKIVSAIYERDMMIRELNTNGRLITQELLDGLKQAGCRAAIKISFDGIGFHDWMRNQKGAEEDAIRAMRLCAANGFETRAQINVNRRNKDAMVETLEFLDRIGIRSARMIRTTEVPRLSAGKNEICLDIDEYYDSAWKTLEAYAAKPHRMQLDIWQFLTYDPQNGQCRFTAKQDASAYRDTRPLCRCVRGMIAVSSDGNVYPCMQSVGTFLADGIGTPNLFVTPLNELLQPDSDYMKLADRKIAERLLHNPECAQCPHWKECQGGCPAIAYICSGGDWMGIDRWKCAFFKGGYDLKKISLHSR